MFFLPCDTFAKNLTVDQDGGSEYTSISAALTSVNYQPGDIIYIQGNDVDTFVEQWPQMYDGRLTIMGASSNRTAFRLSAFTEEWDLFWRNGTGTTRFERIVLENCGEIDLSNSQRILIIDKCIIKNFDSNVFKIVGSRDNYLSSQIRFSGATNPPFFLNRPTLTKMALMEL